MSARRPGSGREDVSGLGLQQGRSADAGLFFFPRAAYGRCMTPLCRLALAALLAATVPAFAAEPSPEEIVRKATDLGQAKASRQKMRMTLRDGKAERVRVLQTWGLRDGQEIATRVEFLEPKDVAGTVLLSVEKGGAVSQHLYLPGVKRVRKLVGSQRGGAFMGSDFSYEDLAPREVEKATYELLREESVAGKACWVVEATPSKGAGSAYSKTVLWIAKDDHLTLRAKFFDAKGAELKTLAVDPANVHVENGVRIPKRLEMTSKKDGHTTVIEVEEIDLAPRLDRSRFEASSLDRG